jgi:hypothetical protein
LEGWLQNVFCEKCMDCSRCTTGLLLREVRTIDSCWWKGKFRISENCCTTHRFVLSIILVCILEGKYSEFLRDLLLLKNGSNVIFWIFKWDFSFNFFSPADKMIPHSTFLQQPKKGI